MMDDTTFEVFGIPEPGDWLVALVERGIANRKKIAASHARRARAYQMRRDGMKYREIGDALGVSTERARDLVAGGVTLENRRLRGAGYDLTNVVRGLSRLTVSQRSRFAESL